MHLSRRVSLTLVVLTATPWAVLMVVAGAWLVLEGAVRWPHARWPCYVGGAFWAASGHLTFSCLVADRLFPHVSRRVSWPVEIATGAAVFVGVLWWLAAFGRVYAGGIL